MVRELFARLMGAWKKIGFLIGDTVARLALFFLFVVTIVPIHYIWVKIGKDPMKRNWDADKKSYLEKSEPLRDDHWERMF